MKAKYIKGYFYKYQTAENKNNPTSKTVIPLPHTYTHTMGQKKRSFSVHLTNKLQYQIKLRDLISSRQNYFRN